MNRFKFIIVSLAAISLSCSEFQEPQIGNRTIEVFVPRDSLRTDIATQLFYWYELEGAASYELQVVSPGFDRIDSLVLDTSLSQNKFHYSLAPGQYQWRIRGYNNSSSTDFTTYTLFIDSTLALSGQTITLQLPPNNDTSNSLYRNFSWLDLYNADFYRFEIWSPNQSGLPIESLDTTSRSLALTLPDQGAYEWRVCGTGINNSQTPFSTRKLYVDTARPQIIGLDDPVQGKIVNSNSFEFSWTRDNSAGSSRTDTLYISKDPGMANPWKIPVRGNSVIMDTLSQGYYYWRVRSSDKAGNIGGFSYIEDFSRQ